MKMLELIDITEREKGEKINKTERRGGDIQ
jgi:hypothetical protein